MSSRSYLSLIKLILFVGLFVSALAHPNPADATAALDTQQVSRKVVPGVDYISIINDTETMNQAIHMLKINLRNPFVKVEIASGETVVSKNTVYQIANQSDSPGHKVVGAVNLDFFQLKRHSDGTAAHRRRDCNRSQYGAYVFGYHGERVLAVGRFPDCGYVCPDGQFLIRRTESRGRKWLKPVGSLRAKTRTC